MKNTTLCYIEKEGKYLMLLRNKKTVDENKNKWIGVGGKFKEGESPEDCLLREVQEETGLRLKSFSYRAVITFCSDQWGTEYMHLFTADDFEGQLTECDEGQLEWIPKEKIMDLELWEGDRAFLKKLSQDQGFFTMKLSYEGDRLVDVKEYSYNQKL